MKNVKSICVYCAHSDGTSEQQEIAKTMGSIIGKSGLQLVYGGACVGLMGMLADAALENGAYVIGFIPHLLDEVEGAHTGIQELHLVDSMHTRKLKMTERADAFVVLPGGFGTLDEFFEVMTWKQLMIHDKPILIVNHKGYWTKLIELMHHVIDHNFAAPEHRFIFQVVDSVEDVLPALKKCKEPEGTFLSHVV